ncbi:MAG: ATP-binding protein [Candidatus Marinimicrobia bacterium]|nr:ATP-binding protein [Candidatus Neomarinimicrobiota bacterium]
MYLARKIDRDLLEWSKESQRKPLLLRGARQVGKSTSVRELAKNFEYFLEINFEEQKRVHSLFDGDLSPRELCDNLSVMYNIPFVAGKTLLFFDEIQACIPAISSLRFFYEKLPDLHVIAAGSLLEFALSELPSFGVGRVRTLFVYPFSFDEFLHACGERLLLKAKQNASPECPLQEAVHRKLLNYLKHFLVLGGMPELISHYVQGENLQSCQRVLDDLIISLKADFTKYKKRVPILRLSEVFDSVVRQTGGKFVYSKAATEANHKQIKEAIELLIMAGLIIPVTHSSSNGIPLGAECDHKKRKMLIFDTGIFQRLLGLDITEILFENNFEMINKGCISELYVGLELLKSSSCYQQQSLYYWQREALNSNAEVDYVIQEQQEIVPIEVKSGKKGSMQSLYLFLKEKKRPFGIRFSLENYSTYNLVRVFPLYAVSDYMTQETVTNKPIN